MDPKSRYVLYNSPNITFQADIAYLEIFPSFGNTHMVGESRYADFHVGSYLGTQVTQIWGDERSHFRDVMFGACMHMC